MVSYLKGVEKHLFDIPHIAFKLFSNIVVPSWADLTNPYTRPNRGVVKADFNNFRRYLRHQRHPLVHFSKSI
jgi:hypothetical protein